MLCFTVCGCRGVVPGDIIYPCRPGELCRGGACLLSLDDMFLAGALAVFTAWEPWQPSRMSSSQCSHHSSRPWLG